jgi:hypothetical protein
VNAQSYIDRLPLLLLQYQFIEEGLKMYIVAVEHAIKERLKGLAHYQVNAKELWKLPLGSLVREFEKRSDRKDIVASLREIIEERNFFAHRGYLLTVDEQNGQADISKLIGRLDAAQAKAKKCLLEVVLEATRVSGEKLSDEALKHMSE